MVKPPVPPRAVPWSSGAVADQLFRQGVAVQPAFLPERLALRLAQQVRQEYDSGAFEAARVGLGHRRRFVPEIRGDHIRWLEEQGQTAAEGALLKRLERLRVGLNRNLMMGLVEWEGHLACYPPGSFYRRHLDVFAHARERKVTTVLYLNVDWQQGDGGELRIYRDGASLEPWVDIPPRAGTLVTFLSEQIYHEVRPATVQRLSVTGWFRVRS